MMQAWPLVIELPEMGNYPHCIRAEYVPGSSPPAYTIDGAPVAIEVVIPEDLAMAGWFWFGSSLAWPASDPQRAMAISTATYPPPGWASERENCFELARQSERRRAEWHQQREDSRAAKATKAKPKPIKQSVPLIAAVQMELL
jgi:hypothetical protein